MVKKEAKLKKLLDPDKIFFHNISVETYSELRRERIYRINTPVKNEGVYGKS